MSEPTFICSAPELADQAQKVALYSHYAAAVAGFGVGAVMLTRSRVQEKIPHILGAVAAFGVGLVALYSQWEYNQFLYLSRETAANAVALHSGIWFVWATLLFVGLSMTPGFRFKRMKKLALIPLIACAFFGFGAASLGDVLSSAVMTITPTAQDLAQVDGGSISAFRSVQKAAAFGSSLMCGIPALVFAVLIGASFVISQAKKVEKRSEENHQMRTGVMTLVAVLIPAFVYGAGSFLIASGENGISRAVLLFNCGDVMSMFFLLCATMSLLGVPANFPKPPKPVKEKKKAKEEPPPVPAESEHPTVLGQQQAYAQAYAQQLYAQQQAYAQYYAQQQQQAQQAADGVPAQMPGQQPQQQAVDPAAMAAYQQQQAQYYAQQQAYAAYQQQQQAYQQGGVPQQQYAQPQQQVYAQAYAQQQTAYMQQQRPAPTSTVRHAAKPVASGGVKKVGGVRPIKKIR